MSFYVSYPATSSGGGGGSGITSLNGLTTAVQTLVVGTAGTDFAIVDSVSSHTFNLPTASASNRGALSSADWTTFNSKLGTALTSAHIFVGNGSNIATDVAMSGDATLANTGALTIANLAVTNAKIANSTIDLTAKVTGVLPFANGGTGQSAYTDGQLLIGNTATGGISKATLTAGSNITITNGNGTISIASTGGGGGGAATTFNVNQTAHGFSVGNVLYISGATTYALAKADAAATSPAVGVVSVVIGANDFTLLTEGQITGLSGLTAGTAYYLSSSSAGATQSTAPTALGQFVVGIYRAYSTTAAVVDISAVPTAVAQSGAFTALTSITTIGATSTNNLHTVDSTGGSFTITLPAANAAASGRVLTFKEITGQAVTNPVTFAPNGTDQIDALNTNYVWRSNYGALRMISDGTSKWWIM